jgi:subtilase family serine protease
MSVEVSLAARNPAALNHTLKALYTKHSGAYHHWLAKGKFDARFAPTAATRAAVGRYLASQGLKVQRSSSPFLVRASGSSQRVSAAFHTTLSNYRNTRGVRYFSNSSAVRLPASLAGRVLGVIGLSSTVREHSMVQRPKGTLPVGKSAKPASCEAPYPTAQQLFDAENGISGFPFGFGGSPGCNGLTPSQDNGIYDAPHVGPRGQGAGVNIAVFELSAYQASDVNAYTTQFYGPNYHAPLVNVNVDGGPLNPVCPAGDICPPNFNGFAGDVEVDADIETQLAIAPAVQHLIVYNAPNDFSGQTELDEYAAIASDDTADSISSSWAVCENDAGTAVVQSERSDGTTIVNVLDPAVAAMGDQRRRHLAGDREPRHQEEPFLSQRRRDGLEHRQPL